MISWTNTKLKFTAGIGALGTTALLADTSRQTLPIWLVMLVALLPLTVFLFIRPDEVRRSIALPLQIIASLWYLVLSVVLSILFFKLPEKERGWPIYFICQVVGAVPCIIVLWNLLSNQQNVPHQQDFGRPSHGQFIQLPSRYSYNPGWRAILGGIIFFGGCSAFMVHEAIHNKVGLVIDGVIKLGPNGATIFDWSIAAAGGMFVLVALLLIVRRLANPQILVLETDALLLPYGFFQTHVTRISYVDIQNVSEVQMSKQTFLYITAHGRRFTITASLLPDAPSYAAIKDFLFSRVRVAQN